MAHYVSIPKDLNDIKEKFIMGLTKRQVICFSIGLVIGAPVFFITKSAVGLTTAMFAMGACAAPAILCGLKATPHKDRLSALLHICTTIFVRYCLDFTHIGKERSLYETIS
jgi:hypothetical protein